jgi:hypothetical protein
MANRDETAAAEVSVRASQISLWAAELGVPPEAVAAALYEEVSSALRAVGRAFARRSLYGRSLAPHPRQRAGDGPGRFLRL